ncbi:MAG: dihydrodipicolinate synthase family protein [Christensenellaceae bacterium]|nr:dihydrodipicolinate synthase family protein [Christensenellaceae bacterium]MEA5065624.1 dihydrodipicolinate synthase family protein [Eubacteriales bacterium]MEA5068326.1 dihydrodipicolinate synthase family protein [Christensenellaceae bacterium]
MKNTFPGGVWPVMLTPFTEDDRVDLSALEALTDWYIAQGASGLFAVCQSSEMFFLSLEERVALAETVVRAARGRVPVIASGHVSDAAQGQLAELRALSAAGVEALVLISNRMAAEGESDEIWRARTQALMDGLPEGLPLGLYECPFPYKRLVSLEGLRWAARTGRFFFMKDTCCDEALISRRIEAIAGTEMRLYNANSTTLLSSLQAGAAGYSGVMASFHPALYARLCTAKGGAEAERLSDFLSIASLIERQCYPVNAKYHLGAIEGLKMTTRCRVKDDAELSPAFKREVEALDRMARRM